MPFSHPLRKAPLLLVLVALVFGAQQSRAERCPSVKQVKRSAKITLNRNLEVVAVTPSEVKGLCQVHIRLRGKNRVIYTDQRGEYLMTGQIFRVSDRTNITREALADLNRLSREEMKQLDRLTAFTVGKGKKLVYLITDPQCPFCKRAEDNIEPMIASGEITLKVLLYPLPFHKGAREECISIICDETGMEGLKTRYRSENQCKLGIRKVEDTIGFLQKKGITGTPTYVFPDGRYHSGVLSEDQLRAKMQGSQGRKGAHN